MPLPPDLGQGELLLAQHLGRSQDINYHRIALKWQGRVALLVFIDGLTSSDTLHTLVLRPLMNQEPVGSPADLAGLGRALISVAAQRCLDNVLEVRDEVYTGRSALLVDGFPGALVLETQGWEERPIQSPPTDSPLRGPRDGFIENITNNIALVRRRLRDPRLVVRFLAVGRRSRTRVGLVYLEDLARPELVQEIDQRIRVVEFDGILDANVLREFLVGRQISPFPKMELTERPDTVAAALLSGRVAVFVDNSPFVAIAPVTIMDFFWAPDDYYTHPYVTALVRTVRVLGWLATVLLPPLYVAAMMYNPDIIRTDLALFLMRERLGVPLTAAMEVFFLEVVMEMIHEATIRVPAKVGSAATVVGGLIIGQVAVQARVISSLVAIIAAISAIGSFTLPGPEIARVWRLVKWALVVSASLFGVYGVFAGFFCLVSWIAAQNSFGTPYLAPVAPVIPGDLARDSLVRAPWNRMVRRPAAIRARDRTRTGIRRDQKPPDGEGQ